MTKTYPQNYLVHPRNYFQQKKKKNLKNCEWRFWICESTLKLGSNKPNFNLVFFLNNTYVDNFLGFSVCTITIAKVIRINEKDSELDYINYTQKKILERLI